MFNLYFHLFKKMDNNAGFSHTKPSKNHGSFWKNMTVRYNLRFGMSKRMYEYQLFYLYWNNKLIQIKGLNMESKVRPKTVGQTLG